MFLGGSVITHCRAEIQQLRSKENGGKGAKQAQAQQQKPGTSAGGGRPGAKRKAAADAATNAQQKAGFSTSSAAALPSSPPAFPEEYGRRQSKRICVSRSRFLYGMF